MIQSYKWQLFLLELTMSMVWSTFVQAAVTFSYATLHIASPIGAHQKEPCHSRILMEIDCCQ